MSRTTNSGQYTLTLEQYVGLFRERGIPMDKKRLSDGIKAGFYPGRVVSEGPTGRTTFEIWRVDAVAFLDSKKPAEVS